MSDPNAFDDDLANLLAEEAQTTRIKEWLRETKERIVQVLDQQEAQHIWHPDPTEQATIEHNALEAWSAESSDPLNELQRLLQYRVEDELVRVATIAKVIAAQEHDPPTEQQPSVGNMKKQVMAELTIAEYDNGWLLAVDILLEGDPLDTANSEADQRLYAKVLADHLNPKDPYVGDEELRNLLYGILLSNDSDEANNATILLQHSILRARSAPGQIATLEEHLSFMQRRGMIDAATAQQARQLSRPKPDKT